MKIQYGILSTASIVPRFVNAVRSSGKGEITAIASRSLEKAKQKAEELGIERYYGSYLELMQDPEVNVIYVATINSEHYHNCVQALENGKHVICEKPFVLKKAQAEHLFALAKERNLFIMEAQKVVFLPVMGAVKQLLNSGKLGHVQLIDLTSSCESTYNNWLGSLAAGGGSLYGNASYTLQLLRFLFGQMPVYRSGAAIKSESGADVQCVINLTIGESILAISKISTRVNAINKAFFYAEKGYVEIADYWKARKAVVHYADGTEDIIEFPCEFELVYEVEHIYQCLNQQLLQSPLMDQNMTIDTVGLLENIHLSWK